MDEFLVEVVEWFLTTFLSVPREKIMVEPRVSRIVVRASDLWGIFNNFCIIVVGTKNSLNWSQLNKANHKNAYSIQFWSYVINSFMHHHTTLKLKICSTKTTFKSIIVLIENYNFLLSLHNHEMAPLGKPTSKVRWSSFLWITIQHLI